MKLLLEKGADPDAANDLGETALMVAVGKGNLEAVKLLLPRMKNINAKNIDGDTAIDVALGQRTVDLLLPVLKEAGANLLTEKVVSSLSHSLADQVGSGLRKALTSRHSADAESIFDTLTNGLVKLEKMGVPDQQMVVARSNVTEVVKNEFYKAYIVAGSNPEKEDVDFRRELLVRLMPQLPELK